MATKKNLKKTVLNLNDQTFDLTSKKGLLELNIRGQVKINWLDQQWQGALELIINLAPYSQLIFNSFIIALTSQQKIIMNQTNNSQLIFNYAVLAFEPIQLTMATKITGSSNLTELNVNAVCEAKGQITVMAEGIISPQTKDNQLAENLKCLVLNKSTNKIVPNLIVNTNETAVYHNATIGPIDPRELFYLRSKGISNPMAIKLIRNGFLTKKLTFEPIIKNKIASILNQKGE